MNENLMSKSNVERASRGRVYLVGAGPGDPDLLTLKAARLLAQADVVLIDDLASDELLAFCPQARVIRVGKRGGCKSTAQAFIEKLLVHEARAGHKVVRLKGGDPSVFGRAGEEIAALNAAGVDYEFVPGVSAGLAAAAQIGASLTHRDHAQGVAFVTAHGAEGGETDWRALAKSALTLVVYMGVSRSEALQTNLLEGGMSRTTPVIAVENASRNNARMVVSTVAEMAQDFAREALQSPAVLLIGNAMRERAFTIARDAAIAHEATVARA
jgi:uroporphyrin-III C-methyltransferase